MVKYQALAIARRFWRPGEDYLEEIIEGVKGKISGGDFLVVSEKAISTATGNIMDEKQVTPGLAARLIAQYWMPIVWGYILGPLCHFGVRLLGYLRGYPVEMGSRHKQVALEYAGLSQALMFGSEGGIDGSNLAYAYVSLPLDNADEIAERIRRGLSLRLGKEISVMIVDTDKTYSFRNFHFTPRPKPMEGIHSFGGWATYVVGRVLNLEKNPTPIAMVGDQLEVKEALRIARIANYVRGVGAGKTVWDMAERFDVQLADVSWEMLETVKHKPVVIVRETER